MSEANLTSDPLSKAQSIKYYVCHELELLGVGDSFGPPDQTGWDEITREEFDELHKKGYMLEGDFDVIV